MQHQYQRGVHHASALILAHHYERASSILAHLAKQGFTNAEVAVLHSYCLSKIDGPQAAIAFLQQSGNEGPLISMAAGQYKHELGDRKGCRECLADIEQPEGSSPLQAVVADIDVILAGGRPQVYVGEYKGIDAEAINLVNDVVGKYKDRIMSGLQAKKQLLEIASMREPKGKLKQYLDKFIKYLDASAD